MKNQIVGRPVTPDSLRGIMRIAMDAQREISPWLKNWDSIPECDKPKIRKWVENVRNLWEEVQYIGYNCSDDVVRVAFAK